LANQRSTFQKRNREQKLKDKARAKEERRAQKKAGTYVAPDASAVSPPSDDSPPPPPGDNDTSTDP
jgi:hypothetical protein